MSDQSAFDIAVTEAKEQLKETTKNTGQVAIVLQAAGVSEQKIAEVVSNPSLVDLVMRRPEVAQEFAQRYPASFAISYFDQLSALGFQDPQTPVFDGFQVAATGPVAQTSPTGAIKFPNGVLFDPSTGGVAYPPNNPNLAGSPAWLTNVFQWSDKQVSKFRDELAENGYLASAKGGVDVEFVEALKAYHDNRYIYGGGEKFVPLSKTEAKTTREDFGGILDKAVLEDEVQSWSNEVFGDDLVGPELESLVSRMRKVAMRLANKKGFEPAEAAAVAGARVQKRFQESPEVKTFTALEDENTEMADGIVTVLQALRGMG